MNRILKNCTWSVLINTNHVELGDRSHGRPTARQFRLRFKAGGP